MKRLLFIFSFFFLFVLNGKTQEVEILTLEDCLRIGIDNNLAYSLSDACFNKETTCPPFTGQ